MVKDGNNTKAKRNSSTRKLLEINAGITDLARVTSLAWDAVLEANDPPYLFRQGYSIVRLEKDEKGAPLLRTVNVDVMRHEFARVARWFHIVTRNNNRTRETTKPPLDVVRNFLATPDPPLPSINRIIEAPVFAADGTLQTKPGFHPSTGMYYAPVGNVYIPEIPKNPSAEEITQARELVEEMICDFPFVSEADRAHAIALFLLPFARDLIEGPTPCHLIEAPTPGSGKGLLADVIMRPAFGRHIGVVTQAHNGDEWRKRLTAQFRALRGAILIDNVTKILDSGELAAALTATHWEDRILTKSEVLKVPIHCVWVCTANNPTMSTEMARRNIRIRLDPGIDRPWITRDGFKHEDLRRWADKKRGELIKAALVMIQAWLSVGRPKPECKRLGSFEDWSDVIGGILKVAGVHGFLSNLSEFYEMADLEGAIWRDFVIAWWGMYKSEKVSVAKLFDIAVEEESFELVGNTERAQRISFGRQLARQKDRVIGDYRIMYCGTVQRVAQWRLMPLNPEGQ
jgi:hypothetical protein